MPNKEALFCVRLAPTAIGLTGVCPAFDEATIVDSRGMKKHYRTRQYGGVSLVAHCYMKS